jgi:hypothetical protein
VPNPFHKLPQLPPLETRAASHFGPNAQVCSAKVAEAFALAFAADAVRALLPAWLTIDQAPHDGQVVLVNDTTEGGGSWVAAKYFASDEWSGWIYDDDALSDTRPQGPMPTHFLVVPALPALT